MADGECRPADNVPFATDTSSGAVAGMALDNSGSDMGKAPMSDARGVPPAAGPASGRWRLRQARRHRGAGLAGVETFVPVAVPGDKTRDRHQPRPDDSPAVAQRRQRMATEAAKAIYEERPATAELANAQARDRALARFPVRGIDKLEAVAVWHALAHHMTGTWRLAAT